jgi:hypothetical protein
MKIILIDALGGEVAGSCYNVQTTQPRTVIDRSLFQGGKNSETLIALPTSTNRKLHARLIQRRHRLLSTLPKMS